MKECVWGGGKEEGGAALRIEEREGVLKDITDSVKPSKSFQLYAEILLLSVSYHADLDLFTVSYKKEFILFTFIYRADIFVFTITGQRFLSSLSFTGQIQSLYDQLPGGAGSLHGQYWAELVIFTV